MNIDIVIVIFKQIYFYFSVFAIHHVLLIAVIVPLKAWPRQEITLTKTVFGRGILIRKSNFGCEMIAS